jgi:hypothetical protein
MKRLTAVLLLLSLLLCGCAKTDKTPATTAPVTVPGTTGPESTQPPVQGTTAPPETTVPPVTDPPVTQPPETTAPVPAPYAHPLTGEGIYEPYMGRPVAVMLNNVKAAMPQHGVSQADILFEMATEGNTTRCMGIYSDVSDIVKLGSIRSARLYFAQVTQGFNAVLVHVGGSPEALEYIKDKKLPTLNGTVSNAFYRDQDRLDKDYAVEHTVFINGESLLDAVIKKGYSMTNKKEVSYGFRFAEDMALGGDSAKKLTVYFSTSGKASGKSTVLTFDENTGTYFAQQFGEDYIDANNGETVAFRNVLVLRAKTSLQTDGKHLTIDTVGSGEGFFACDGEMVSIKWSRKTVNDPFTFTLEDGTPVTLGVGKTYIAVVPTNAKVVSE